MTTYEQVVIVAFVLVVFTAIGAPIMKTPYGRFGNVNFGIKLDPRLGWFLMELPAMVFFHFFYFSGSNRTQLVPLIFLFVWVIHYGNRGFLFPLLMRPAVKGDKSFNLLVVCIGMLVTAIHGYLNGHCIGELGTHYTTEWLTDPRFLAGITIYYTGFILNLQSDAILRNLRPKHAADRSGSKDYRIPKGGLFKFVSSAQYLSELIAWSGFALATWSWGGLFILCISAANLVPRALSTHRWYKETFADYPANRKALIPYLL